MATFEELTDAQRLALAKAGHKLLHNPEVAGDAKRLLMKTDKSLRFPEIETADAVDGQLKKRDEKIEALENKLVQNEAQQRLAEKKAAAAARGLDWDEIQKAITERGIGSVDTAMEFVELTHRAATPTPAAYDEPVDVLPAASEKEFWANPQAATRKMAHQAIDELQQRRRAQR
jgi:hypothetical protein